MSEVNKTEINRSAAVKFLDFLILISTHKKKIILFPLVVAACVGGGTAFLPNTYSASVKFMPPQQSRSSASAMLSQLGAGALGGLATGALGLKNPGDLYVGLLRSRTISDRLVEKFKMKDRYRAKNLTDARMRLIKMTNIVAGKDGLVSLSFEDKDPVFSAEVANAYLSELDRLLQGLAITEASQRRIYFEKQLKESKEALAKAEAEFRVTQERTGLIEPIAQSKAIVESVASLRAQIAYRKVVLGSMKSFATDTNPDAVRINSEIEQLEKLLADNEGGRNKDGKGLVEDLPRGKIPSVSIEYTRRFRDVKYREALFEIMAKQYEMAKADEARDSGVIQIVDAAVPPDKKVGPKRMLITLLSFCATFAAVLLWLMSKGARDRISKSTDFIDGLARLRAGAI